jgi:hypothetical protein
MPKQREITITPDQARALIENGVKFQGATLYQVLGPHYKDIVWIKASHAKAQRTPHISKTHTHNQITKLLG